MPEPSTSGLPISKALIRVVLLANQNRSGVSDGIVTVNGTAKCDVA